MVSRGWLRTGFHIVQGNLLDILLGIVDCIPLITGPEALSPADLQGVKSPIRLRMKCLEDMQSIPQRLTHTLKRPSADCHALAVVVHMEASCTPTIQFSHLRTQPGTLEMSRDVICDCSGLRGIMFEVRGQGTNLSIQTSFWSLYDIAL
jgi:hypothetical protein